MKSVKQRETQDRPKPAAPWLRQCNAFGCPEIGSISHSNAGPAPEDSWFCRFHFGEPSHKWPEITRQRRMEKDSAICAEADPVCTT